MKERKTNIGVMTGWLFIPSDTNLIDELRETVDAVKRLSEKTKGIKLHTKEGLKENPYYDFFDDSLVVRGEGCVIVESVSDMFEGDENGTILTVNTFGNSKDHLCFDENYNEVVFLCSIFGEFSITL